MTREEKLAYLALLEERHRRNSTYQYRSFGDKLYPFQHGINLGNKAIFTLSLIHI